MRTGDRGAIEFLNLTDGAFGAFDIDMERAAVTNKTGVCVDLDSSMNMGCGNSAIAAVKDGIIGCADAFVGKFLCGLALEVKHGDLSTVSIEGNLGWPRTLVAGTRDDDGDGRAGAALECTDPVDCSQKCLYLERTSMHGAGAPPTCALCDQLCTNNAASTIIGTISAIFEDIATVARLIGVCFGRYGLVGCMCKFVVRATPLTLSAYLLASNGLLPLTAYPCYGRDAWQMTLQPQWRKVSTSAEVRCETGDPIGLIAGQLGDMIQDWVEQGATWVMDQANGIVDSIPVPPFITLPRFETPFCMPRASNAYCRNGGMTAQERAAFAECEDVARRGGLHNLCYFARVHAICSSDTALERYNALFSKGFDDASDLGTQLASAFGDSYDALPPALQQIVEEARVSAHSGPDLSARRDICSSEAFGSAMTLDQIVLSCFFALAESWCGDEANDEFSYDIERATFKLPLVRVFNEVPPPPPPPVALSSLQALVEADPVGFQQVTTKLDSVFPRLSHVAQSSVGATIPNSQPGEAPYTADYLVTPQQLTRSV